MPLNIKPSTKTISMEELDKMHGSSGAKIPVRESSAREIRDAGVVDDSREKKRFYLPVLYINDPTYWEDKPNSERVAFTDEVAKDTCVGSCCGVTGLKAGCCQLDTEDMEHVLGFVDEPWIKKTIKWFKNKGVNVTRHDLVIDEEEGKLIGEKFFSGSPAGKAFADKRSYPMLRLQVNGARFACKFLNVSNGMCTIYEQRPDMCRNYLCQYVKANFLVRTKDHPNTYKKIPR